MAENRRESRTPITLKIKFRSSSLAQFIERYSVDISQTGIFIRMKDPLAVGTPLRFEFQLQDATSLIAGEGTVVWARQANAVCPGAAPGMGVRFDKLTGPSQEVLQRILAEQRTQDSELFESLFEAGLRAASSTPPAEPTQALAAVHAAASVENRFADSERFDRILLAIEPETPGGAEAQAAPDKARSADKAKPPSGSAAAFSILALFALLGLAGGYLVLREKEAPAAQPTGPASTAQPTARTR